MSIAAELTKKLYTALGHDLSNQIMALSENLRLLHRYQTNSIEQVRAQYNPEQDLIRDEISALGDDANDEYTDLMAELKVSQDKEDQMIEQIETETQEKEDAINLEKEKLETRLEAMRADEEALGEAIKADNEDFYGYFQ